MISQDRHSTASLTAARFPAHITHFKIAFSSTVASKAGFSSRSRLRRRSSDRCDADDVFDAERSMLRGRGLHRLGLGQLGMPDTQVSPFVETTKVADPQ